MKRRKNNKAWVQGGARPKPPRDEHEVFAELAALCASPGFAHVIAFFCFRDNLVRYKRELTPDDLLHLRSGTGLIRTEISTLVGLIARKPIDLKLPPPDVSNDYLNITEALLRELHESLSSVWFKDFDLEKAKAGEFDPFSSGPALREPIFYGGDSAYSFQYRDFAAKKYAKDKEWLVANKGFDINTALKIADTLGALLAQKLLALRESLRLIFYSWRLNARSNPLIFLEVRVPGRDIVVPRCALILVDFSRE